MSHPAGLPDVFVDRSLGRVEVPRLLRAASLRLVTLAEHYGMPRDEEVEDVEWLKLAGTRGWVVFMKDKRIRRNRREREVVEAFSVRCFCLTRQGLPASQMATRFLDNLRAITKACRAPGPFIYAVEETRIVRRL